MRHLAEACLIGQFWTDHWGDVASALGLVLAAFGFGATLWQLSKAKSASEAAKEAVEELQRDFDLFDLASELARAKGIMEETKRLHRAGAWQILPDRYQSLRECLVGIRDSGVLLGANDQAVLTQIVKQFRELEERVEKSINTKVPSPSVTKLNTIVSEQHDALTELFVALRSSLGASDE